MSKTISEKVLTYVAIGVPLGALVSVSNSKDNVCGIRRGGKYVQMPLQAYESWHRALDGVDAESLREIAARNNDLDDFSDNLAWFVESDLLLPWTGEEGDYRRFEEIRVIPCGIGAGNSADDPTRFAILSRRDATPALWVDFLGYTIWSFCDGVNTLDEACQATANHLGISLDDVRRRTLTLLPALMRNGVAFIDLAI